VPADGKQRRPSSAKAGQSTAKQSAKE
jgi:hypothetical protein